jgi:hypothetical protein
MLGDNQRRQDAKATVEAASIDDRVVMRANNQSLGRCGSARAAADDVADGIDPHL